MSSSVTVYKIQPARVASESDTAEIHPHLAGVNIKPWIYSI